MNTLETRDHHAQLRAWAKGMYPSEAATELLIRYQGGRFARPGNPWVRRQTAWGSDGVMDGPGYWIDFEVLADPSNYGYASGGERRTLLVAAAIGHRAKLDLGDVMCGVGRNGRELILAALSHAGGSHEDWSPPYRVGPDGSPQRLNATRLGPIVPWPADDADDVVGDF